MKIKSPQNTPYRRMLNSKVGRTVKDNKVATGLGVAGGALVLVGGAIQSQLVADVGRYGIIPAVGAGMATFGAAAVHDAAVNDLPTHKGKAALKMGLGTAAALGGTQMVGLAYNIPVLDDALSGTLRLAGENADLIAGAGLAFAGAKAGQFAADKASKALQQEDGRLVNTAMAAGSAVGSVATTLGAVELVGRRFDIPVANKAFTGTVEFLANSAAGTATAGALLAGGGVVAGQQAVKNIAEGGNEFKSAALGIGAVGAGLGGVEMMGNAVGLEATKGLLTSNGSLFGGVSVAAVGAAWASNASDRIGEKGLNGWRGLEMTLAASAVPMGVSIAADGLATQGLEAGFKLAHGAAQASKVVAGVGLGAAAVGFGKQAIDAGRKGKIESTVFHGALAATSASVGLASVGSGLGIPALQEASEAVYNATVDPLLKHVVSPAAEFLVTNPLAGAVALGVGVGGYLYYRSKEAKQ